jgi:hypothetical protein
MKQIALGIMLALSLACGGEDSDGNTNSTQTCKSDHQCENDVCQCTTAGKSGTSCEKDKCEAQCEVCTSG